MAERILIVEDNENLRYDLRRQVNKAHPGCEIWEVTNEFEAIELVGKALFGLILVDINLQKEGGGFDVLRAAKQREQNTQVIVVTSFPTDRHIRLVKEMDGFVYVNRNTPYYLELLDQEVGAALRLFEYRQQQRRVGLLLDLPEGAAQVPRVHILLSHYQDVRASRRPLVLNLDLLKGATAAIGSLVYIEEPEQRNALAQFVGRHIWNRLFRDHETLLLALGEAAGLARDPADLPIRVKSGSEALDLPLELIHDGRGYVALRHPFVRVISDAPPVAPMLPTLLEKLANQETPLRILLLASDTCSLELGPIPLVDDEVDSIYTRLQKILPLPFGPEVKVEVVHSWESNREQVLQKLRRGYHIIHYAGHGVYDRSNPGNSKLYFWERSCQEIEWRTMRGDLEPWYGSHAQRNQATARARSLRGELQGVTARELANCFAQSAPSLVYLNCCQSAQSGGVQHRVFSKSLGLMDAVVRTGVPIVVGHRWPLLDSDSSVKFVEMFYSKLLAEYSPEQALFWARREVPEDDPTWASAVMVVQSF